MKLTLPLPPSHNRLWRAVNGRVIRSKEYRDWIRDCGPWLMLAKGEPLEGAVIVVLDVYFRDRRRDADSAIKPVLDILQGTAYANDRQVRAITLVAHIDRDNPRVEAQIKEWLT